MEEKKAGQCNWTVLSQEESVLRCSWKVIRWPCGKGSACDSKFTGGLGRCAGSGTDLKCAVL